jgi:hypothetical protein
MPEDVTPISENPYAAPQAELRPSSDVGPLASAHTKYLRQGLVAGMQLGGLAAVFVVVGYIMTWGQGSTVTALVLIPVIVFLVFTFIGFVIGFIVQLIAMLFGAAPSDSLIPSLPFPSLEPPEYSAGQELDKTGHYPPPPLS